MKPNPFVAAVALFSCLAATAQTSSPQVPTEFPPGAQTPTAAQLTERLTGQTYYAHLTNGVTWRMQYNNAGYMFVDVSPGGRDTARWRAEEGRTCYEFQRAGPSCAEFRLVGDRLYLKRGTTGEVLALEKK